MTDPEFRHDDLEIRRKRLRFRAWHRGTKEADLLIGPFADSALAGMGHEDLDEFETILRLPDPSLVTWLTGQAELPDDLETPIMRAMIDFQKDK